MLIERIQIVDERSGEIIASSDNGRLTHGETTELLFPTIIEALQSGRKIVAIKMYRTINDCSLKEAKTAIDLLDMALKPYRQITDDLEAMNHLLHA